MRQLDSYLNPNPKSSYNKKLRKYQTNASRRKLLNLDIVVSHKRILDSVRENSTNVERTIFLLMASLISVTAAIVFVIGDTGLQTVNPPNLLAPLEQLSATVVAGISSISDKYRQIKTSVETSKNNFNDKHGSLICPQGRNGLETITTCVFGYGDLLIYYFLDGLEAFTRYVSNALAHYIQGALSDHVLDLDAIISSLRLLVQRAIPLQDPSVEKTVEEEISKRTGESSSAENFVSKASFNFEPFSDDVLEVITACQNQCNDYAKRSQDILFTDVAAQSSNVCCNTPMTVRDYFFNILKSKTVYFCQYQEQTNFGGTWVLLDETCFCSSSCDSSTNFFDFVGCADLLSRINIPCTTDTPCTLERICPFEDKRILIEETDSSTKLYDAVNKVCLDVCSELSGFGDFATLLAISASIAAVPTNLFGAGARIGTELGVPAPLLPGELHIILHAHCVKLPTTSMYNIMYIFIIRNSGWCIWYILCNCYIFASSY